MNPQITKMDADFKLVEFDQFGWEELIPSKLMEFQFPNRVESEAVGNYRDFAKTAGGSAHG